MYGPIGLPPEMVARMQEDAGLPTAAAATRRNAAAMASIPVQARRLPRVPLGLGTGALGGVVLGAVAGSAKPWWWMAGGALIGGAASIWNAYAEYRESQIIIEQGGVALPARR